MRSSEEPRPLQGLARSIDSMFGDVVEEGESPAAEPAPPTPEEASPPVKVEEESVAGETPPPGADGRAEAGAGENVRSADPLADMEFLPVPEEDGGSFVPEDPSPWLDEEEPVTELDLSFDDESPESAGGDAPESPEWAGEDTPEAPDREGAHGGTSGLEAALDDYLTADPGGREGPAHRVRDVVTRLRELGEIDLVADAVERLAGASAGGSVQEAPVALARLLTTPMVASRLVGRLGLARQEDERDRLVAICGSLGREMAVALGDALSQTDDRAARRTYMDALVALGEEGLAVVADMVEDPRWFVVRNAVLVLGEAGGERAVQHLTVTLAHDDPRVRRETLMALARIGGDDAVMLVPGKLSDADPDVREAAAMAAGALRIERAQRALVARLEEEENPDVLAAVLRALGQLGDPGAVPAIEKKAVGSFFSRPPTEVRVAAYRALAAIGTPHAMEVVGEATDDKDAAVRTTARGLVGESGA